MPTLALICHPSSPCPAVRGIAVDVRPGYGGQLALRYRLAARPDDLRLPPAGAPAAADNLWQTSCLEAFIASPDGSDYREFNFSPSRQWAAYRFTDYRQRDEHFLPPGPPHIELDCRAEEIILDATIGPELLPDSTVLIIGLCAVVEAADGSKSYWALRHGAAQPDFHLRPSFTLTLNRA